MTIARDRFRDHPSSTASSARRALRVVLVEDDADVRVVVSSLLELWGNEVVGEAATGPQGIHLIGELRPDVAIIDVGLPELDGNTVAQRTRSRFDEECPWLIAMSGYANTDQVMKALFDVVLDKPPDPSALQQALDGASGRGHEGR